MAEKNVKQDTLRIGAIDAQHDMWIRQVRRMVWLCHEYSKTNRNESVQNN